MYYIENCFMGLWHIIEHFRSLKHEFLSLISWSMVLVSSVVPQLDIFHVYRSWKFFFYNTCNLILIGEKAILHECAVFSLACSSWKYGCILVQYPAILPSHPSNNRYTAPNTRGTIPHTYNEILEVHTKSHLYKFYTCRAELMFIVALLLDHGSLNVYRIVD